LCLTPFRTIRDWNRQKEAAQSLKQAAISQSPVLSKDSRIKMLTNQLEEKLQEFKQDVENGVFS
jgi:succinoglycan biosynthesis protein ExoV